VRGNLAMPSNRPSRFAAGQLLWDNLFRRRKRPVGKAADYCPRVRFGK
jgi:hypothetical protein